MPLAWRKKELKMIGDIVEGNWKHFNGKLKALWNILGDEPPAAIPGSRARLVGKVGKAYGITPDEAEKLIKYFA